jgi:hypothetical protein
MKHYIIGRINNFICKSINVYFLLLLYYIIVNFHLLRKNKNKSTNPVPNKQEAQLNDYKIYHQQNVATQNF